MVLVDLSAAEEAAVIGCRNREIVVAVRMSLAAKCVCEQRLFNLALDAFV